MVPSAQQVDPGVSVCENARGRDRVHDLGLATPRASRRKLLLPVHSARLKQSRILCLQPQSSSPRDVSFRKPNESRLFGGFERLHCSPSHAPDCVQSSVSSELCFSRYHPWKPPSLLLQASSHKR